MGTRRATVTLHSEPVFSIEKRAFGKGILKIVYILVANKPIRYRWGRWSRVVYIGTTKRGPKRIAESVVAHGKKALAKKGITSVEAYVIQCRPRRAVEMWKKLESALIFTFRGRYGDIPKYNTKLKNSIPSDEFDYFHESYLRKKLLKFEER